jgi:hypothetical protein
VVESVQSVESGKANYNIGKIRKKGRKQKMGRKQTKRQQRRAKKEEGKKKRNTAKEEDEEEIQNRSGWNDDDKVGGKETSKEDKDVQNRIAHAENLRKKTATENDEEDGIKIDGIDDRNEYPTLDEYRRAKDSNDMQETLGSHYRLAVESGDVQSMGCYGFYFSECDQVRKKKLHVATPWLLEGAIRGSGACQLRLTVSVYKDVKPRPPAALNNYWLKMHAKFNACNYSEIQNDSIVKKLRNEAEKFCGMCLKTDSKTVVLQQCKGCSLYCYCSETCQTAHWEEDNHRGECKQLCILNKYHKPYAKEIRDAATTGNDHPALDKLRHKLGLSRPLQEYEELMVHNTHDGKSIDIKDYLVGRDDGTVWVGSTPDPIESYEKNASSKNDSTDYFEQGDG